MIYGKPPIISRGKKKHDDPAFKLSGSALDAHITPNHKICPLTLLYPIGWKSLIMILVDRLIN